LITPEVVRLIAEALTENGDLDVPVFFHGVKGTAKKRDLKTRIVIQDDQKELTALVEYRLYKDDMVVSRDLVVHKK
jgi:hypothetical protein